MRAPRPRGGAGVPRGSVMSRHSFVSAQERRTLQRALALLQEQRCARRRHHQVRQQHHLVRSTDATRCKPAHHIPPAPRRARTSRAALLSPSASRTSTNLFQLNGPLCKLLEINKILRDRVPPRRINPRGPGAPGRHKPPPPPRRGAWWAPGAPEAGRLRVSIRGQPDSDSASEWARCPTRSGRRGILG